MYLYRERFSACLEILVLSLGIQYFTSKIPPPWAMLCIQPRLAGLSHRFYVVQLYNTRLLLRLFVILTLNDSYLLIGSRWLADSSSWKAA